jgi:hypothetical protein
MVAKMSYKEFQSHILKHGVSRTNRFRVLIPLPSGLTNQISQDKDKSKLAELFGDVVKIIKVFTGPSTTEVTRGLDLMCTQTELPGKTINVSEAKYNGDVYKVGHSIMYAQQQFVFKVSSDMHEKNLIDSWQSLIINPHSHEVAYFNEYSTDITIFQLNQNDEVVHAVKLEGAFPVMFNPLTLSNNEMNNAHELMVQFAYTKWTNLELDPAQADDVSSLSQTPLGPYIAPILSNPVVQRALDYVESTTGLDLEGEAVNIYNQIDGIVRETTGESINKTVGLLNSMKASISINDKITNNQAAELIDIVDGTLSKLTG